MRTYKALTIAGSDSGGGAGIQADLKTFQELEVFGMSAITAVTAQNTLGVQGIYSMSAEAVERQIQSIAEDLPPDAIKTGMLFSADIIQAVAGILKHHHWNKVVVDPVMIAKGGASLLQIEAIHALKTDLLPITYVLTPNIPEAEELTGMAIKTADDKREASKHLMEMGPRYVILKGGHDDEDDKVVDLLFDGVDFYELSDKRIQTKNTHGTGCTFSAAITAELAKGKNISESFMTARTFIQAAITNQLNIGRGHGPTNHWAYKKLQNGDA
jgi:hydroxymethylpyrimidine/phosphomethylpyrimidine kinase